MASALTTAVAIVTTCWLKRSAAQIMSGRIANVSGNGEGNSVAPLKIRSVRITNSDPKQAASSIFWRDQGAALWRRQLNISGVTMMIPVTSPCHHVHQFGRCSGQATEPTTVIDSTAIVAAMVQLTAARATN